MGRRQIQRFCPVPRSGRRARDPRHYPVPEDWSASSTPPVHRHGRTCPHCQSPHTHLLQGNEMMIKEVEAVEPETSEASG